MELNVIRGPDIDLGQIIEEIRTTLTTADENEITDEQAMEAIEDYVLRDKRLAMRSPKETRSLIRRIF